MSYFNYHATAKRLINQNKLIGFYFCNEHNDISPALVLVFDSPSHKLMPIRKEKFLEYLALLEEKGLLDKEITLY